MKQVFFTHKKQKSLRPFRLHFGLEGMKYIYKVYEDEIARMIWEIRDGVEKTHHCFSDLVSEDFESKLRFKTQITIILFFLQIKNILKDNARWKNASKFVERESTHRKSSEGIERNDFWNESFLSEIFWIGWREQVLERILIEVVE